MKAIAVFPDTREIRLIDQPERQLRTSSDVRLRMLGVRVCGTEREICAFQYGTPPAGRDHLVTGHESFA